MLKASEEFVVGKHGIGYVSSDFSKYFKDTEFELKSIPKFQKLPHSMNDAAIESELKPGICDLGDVLAFLDNPQEGTKDGYSNIFYTANFVVCAFWDGGAWGVYTWGRGGHDWSGSSRVFSPATNSLDTQNFALGISDTLSLEKAIELIKKAGYRIFKEI